MKNLIDLEIQLHQKSIRNNKEKLIELLHPDFYEIGRSGNSYGLNEILNLLDLEQEESFLIHSQNFDCQAIDQNSFLLTYQTAVIQNEKVDQFAKRSSIWCKYDNLWKMRFHQGTACEEFELV